MSPHREPRSPGVKVRPPMQSQPVDSNPPMLPAAGCITNEDLWVVVQRLDTGQREILGALKGNNLGNKGVLPRLDDIEERQDKQDRKMIKWGGMVAGGAVALTMLKDWIFPHKS